MISSRLGANLILILTFGLLASVNSERVNSQIPRIVQREKNTFLNASWALSRRGNLLVTSSLTNSTPHVWTNGKFVSANQTFDKAANDFLLFADGADILFMGSSPALAKHKEFLLKGQPVEPEPDAATSAAMTLPQNVQDLLAKRNLPTPSRFSKSATPEIRLYRNPSKTTLSKFGSIELKPTTAWLAITDDGTKVAMFDEESKSIELVQLAEGFNSPQKRLNDILYPTNVYDICLSAQGGQLLVAQEMRLSLIDTAGGKLIQSMPLPEDWVQPKFAFGGRYLVAKKIGEESAKAIVMEVTTGRILEFPIDPADQVHVTPDGQWLVRIDQTNLEFVKLSNRGEKYAEMLHDGCHNNCQLVFAANAGRAVIWSDEPPRMYVAEFPFAIK